MRYKLTGVNDEGDIVELEVSAATRERRRGFLEGQGYVVTVTEVSPPVAPKSATKSSRATTSPASSPAGETSSATSWGLALIAIAGALVAMALIGWLMWTLLSAVGVLLFLVLMFPIGVVLGVIGIIIENAVNRRKR